MKPRLSRRSSRSTRSSAASCDNQLEIEIEKPRAVTTRRDYIPAKPDNEVSKRLVGERRGEERGNSFKEGRREEREEGREKREDGQSKLTLERECRVGGIMLAPNLLK